MSQALELFDKSTKALHRSGFQSRLPYQHEAYRNFWQDLQGIPESALEPNMSARAVLMNDVIAFVAVDADSCPQPFKCQNVLLEQDSLHVQNGCS